MRARRRSAPAVRGAWDVLICVLCLLSMVWVPLDIAFALASSLWGIITSSVFDGACALDGDTYKSNGELGSAMACWRSPTCSQ